MKNNKGIKSYTDAELNKMYEYFIASITKDLENDPRLPNILKMYGEDELGPNLCLAPASGNNWFHCAWQGGYMEHVLNVVKACKYMHTIFEKMGGDINYTMEELLFVAYHHDLGKLGSKGEPYYIPEESDWWRENRGRLFTHNPALSKITVTDRGLITLQEYNISYTEAEWLGIKTSDGMYDETNKYYLIAGRPQDKLKTNIPLVVHWADHMATTTEYDAWKKENPGYSL